MISLKQAQKNHKNSKFELRNTLKHDSKQENIIKLATKNYVFKLDSKTIAKYYPKLTECFKETFPQVS
jgi:hypothetical protein